MRLIFTFADLPLRYAITYTLILPHTRWMDLITTTILRLHGSPPVHTLRDFDYVTLIYLHTFTTLPLQRSRLRLRCCTVDFVYLLGRLPVT